MGHQKKKNKYEKQFYNNNEDDDKMRWENEAREKEALATVAHLISDVDGYRVAFDKQTQSVCATSLYDSKAGRLSSFCRCAFGLGVDE